MRYTKSPLGAQPNWSHPLMRGLVGGWLLNERSGPRAWDFSLTRAHGTLTGFDQTLCWRPATGLAFDGVDDRVLIGNQPQFQFDRTNAWSISLWLTVPTTPTTADWLVAKLDGSFVGYSLALRGDVAGDPLDLELRGANQYFHLRSGAQTWVVGRRTHLVWTFDGSNSASGMRLYRDGVVIACTDFSVSFTSESAINSGDLAIGAVGSGSLPTIGTLDDVRIYARAITASECLQLCVDPFGMFDVPRAPGTEGMQVAFLAARGLIRSQAIPRASYF